MKNSQRGFVTFLTLIVVVAIGVGAYYWQRISSMKSLQNNADQNTSQVMTAPQASVDQTSRTTIHMNGSLTPEQIEQEKNKENIVAQQNKPAVVMVSKPCLNGIKAEESSSVEYSKLVPDGWTFKNAIISDFDCDGSQDVLVASFDSVYSKPFFKGNLQFFQKVSGSWKLINQKDFLGEPFEIHSGKTPEGGNAAVLTFSSHGRTSERIIWIRNGYPTGI